jgi:cobalt/nickel transport system permease protein
VGGGLALVSAPAVSWAARKAQAGSDEGRAPLLGIMGAFVFAAQMINFPVGVGASGHLVGSALLTATLGPWAAAVVMTAILIIQALIFQDGGVAALGANVFNMALAGVAAGYLPFVLMRAPRWRLFASGFLSVWTASTLAIIELRLSGAHIPPPTLTAAVAIFAVNALLEGLITVAVVQAIGRINSGWVKAAEPWRTRTRAAVALAALALAGAGFLLASALPDGLEHLMDAAGLKAGADSGLAAPMADYDAQWLAHPWLRRSAAGLFGLACTYLLCLALGRALTRWRSA